VCTPVRILDLIYCMYIATCFVSAHVCVYGSRLAGLENAIKRLSLC
jgi:hypothetical protein